MTMRDHIHVYHSEQRAKFLVRHIRQTYVLEDENKRKGSITDSIGIAGGTN